MEERICWCLSNFCKFDFMTTNVGRSHRGSFANVHFVQRASLPHSMTCGGCLPTRLGDAASNRPFGGAFLDFTAIRFLTLLQITPEAYSVCCGSDRVSYSQELTPARHGGQNPLKRTNESRRTTTPLNINTFHGAQFIDHKWPTNSIASLVGDHSTRNNTIGFSVNPISFQNVVTQTLSAFLLIVA